MVGILVLGSQQRFHFFQIFFRVYEVNTPNTLYFFVNFFLVLVVYFYNVPSMFRVWSFFFFFFFLQMSYNSEEFVREMIELYRSLPCLWKIKSADYSKRIKKREAYEKMIALFKCHNPSEKVDETLVRQKIQSLRTVYKKELNKVEKSRKSGAGTDEVYVPSLWYYDLLGFTCDEELPRKIVSSMRPNVEPDPEIENDPDSPVGDHWLQEQTTQGCDTITESERSMEEALKGSSQEPAPLTLSRWQTNSRKRKGTLPPSPDLMCLANQIMANSAMDSFANFAADRLGMLDANQRKQAERVIFETLSEAASGRLDETSTVKSVIARDPSWPHSWTQIQEPLRSTPVRRIGPPQNHPLPPPNHHFPDFSQSFLSELSSLPRRGFSNQENQYEDL
ncbi:uncharacterized protein [Dendrobates tinctorius]|uniref:uncharacterized protein n=1 Tax=Dendrobates tinctorius TaxID=92724 RepID=UPI003CC9C5B7